MQRADYDEQWHLIVACCGSKKKVIDLHWSRSFSLAPLRRWSRFPYAFRCASGGGGDRLLDALLCLYYLDVLYAYAQARPKAVVFFAEMRPVENVLVQFFNRIGVPTITLQHGLYIDYRNQRTINRLNYEASCAQTLLAWGQETAELIKRFNPKAEAVICGAPQIADRREEVEPRCVYVVFDADLNCQQNQKLLDVGKQLGREMGLEVVVGLHPRNRRDLYDLAGVSFLPDGDDYCRGGYVLGHTTTQIIKLARLGKRVFKLKSQEPCNRLIPEGIQFSTIEDLRDCIAGEDYPNGWALAHIHTVAESSLQCYRRFFVAKC